MKYLFILGRNVELSVLEIESFFEKEKINFKIISKVNNGILVETSKRLETGIVNKFGGVVSIGEVLFSGNIDKIIEELDKTSLYEGKSNKLNYVIIDFNGKNLDDISFYLKKRFRQEKLKATEKKLTGNIKMQTGETISKVSSNLINEQYFLFENNFGKIIEKYDYVSVEKRDMGKPVRRSELSISPRLAKILINISGVRKGETLLDPFCGIGVILQEALLQNIKVIGVDKDKTAIHDAKLNLEWFNLPKNNYRLIGTDSSKVKISKVDAIATEPDLGELQKRVPSKEKVKEILSSFERLMINVLKNLKGNVKGKIVFTSPLIQTEKQRFSCDINKIISETGLKLLHVPINEFRENSIVGRTIFIMEN